MYFFTHLEWRRTGFTNLINKGKGETMLKVKRKIKRKDGTKEKKHTNSIARIQQLLASPAWNFTTQPRKKKYKICSISEYYVTINHATHRGLKRNTSRAVSNANKGKKKWLSSIVQTSFAEKHFKAEESVTLQNIFSSVADFRHVVSVLPAARLIKASRIIVALQKANRPSEIKKSSLVFWLSS